MSLFQQSVIKKHISDLDENKLQQGWNHFESYFKDNAQQQIINESKEEEFQVLFLTNLFDKCLGFNIDGINKNLFIEYKNVTSSEKADGAVKINDEVVAVIELKSAKTKDFKEIQKQAFGYKVSHPNCKYVVTSNFNKLRFYIENATAFEEFDLFNLTYERFKLLWLCLSFESVSSGIPLKIKSESTLNEENITKKLYKDYSLFRKEIFNNIVEKNQHYDKLTLFNKTQKLLDRFLFIFFAEDRRLLPVNSISQIIEKWEDDIAYGDEKSLYTSFKLYFNLLNKGRPASEKREEIFAYNGGLFAPDDTLDSISIDDKLLSKHTKNLSTYDFESDVSVNILGHIFEHSLSEIEEIQNEITGAETDKTSSKRKKDGVFYTPSYITKYIVDNTVGKLCQEKKEELEINEEVYTQRKARSKKRIDNLDAYRNWLLEITICDPACGSGAFLVQALDFLIEEHKYIDELNAAYHGASIPFSDITSSILENNLYGVDINGESVEIAKLSLWLRTAQKGRKLTSLNSNLKCGNSLIDDPEVAGDKAFNWENEFPEVFAKGGFDVVIGNPPYVRAEIISNKLYLEKKYLSFNGNADLYVFFFEKSINCLKENGFLSFIAPNKWTQSNYGLNLRRFINKYNLLEFIDFGEANIFEGVGTFPSIPTIRKTKSDNDFNFCEVTDLNQIKSKNLHFLKFTKIKQDILQSDSWHLKSSELSNLISKLEKTHTKLGKVLDNKFFAGIKTGSNKLFIYSQSEVAQITGNSEKELKAFKRICFGKEIDKYTFRDEENKFVFFPYEFVNGKQEIISIDDFPNIKEHFSKKYDDFVKRAIIKEGVPKGTRSWFELQQVNKFLNYNLPKIIYPDISLENRFVFDDSGIIPDMTCFILPYNYKYLVPVLNSRMFKFLASNYCPVLGNIKQGGRIRYKSTYLAKIPFPVLQDKLLSTLENNYDKSVSRRFDFNSLKNKFLRFISSSLNISLTGKFINWTELEYSIFLKELNKQLQSKLSKSDEMDWMEVFETKKAEAQDLKAEIDNTDKEIDQMVYELYGLTQEEIEIVENATK
jgi:type I restriction-modification system DNA methylase subunit